MVTSGIEQEEKRRLSRILRSRLPAQAGASPSSISTCGAPPSIGSSESSPAWVGRRRLQPSAAFGRALVRVDLGDQLLPTAMGSPYGFSEGSLDILPSGSRPPNAGEFVARLPLGPILAYFQGQTDIVLIDGPPLLRVGDAIAVSSEVDALAVVARLNVARGPMLDELGRVLRSSRPPS